MNRLQFLLNNNALGNYTYAVIEQVVLIKDTDNSSINYFTHIDLKRGQAFEDKNEYLTKGKTKINSQVSMGAKKIILPVDKLYEIYDTALEKGVWRYDEDIVGLDNIFESSEKFVPSKDPTGGKLNHLTPLEWGLYGSNFNGSYYVIELFSNKSIIHELLSKQDIAKVNQEMKKVGLGYNLDYLNERIGNIVFKIKPNILETKLVLANSNLGIKVEFLNIVELTKSRKYTLQFRQEFDGMIYENKVLNSP